MHRNNLASYTVISTEVRDLLFRSPEFAALYLRDYLVDASGKQVFHVLNLIYVVALFIITFSYAVCRLTASCESVYFVQC